MELRFLERELLMRNDLGMSFRSDYTKIIAFGKAVVGDGIFIILLYKGIVPFYFRTSVKSDEIASAVLGKLTDKTGKEPNVIFEKKKTSQS